MEIVHITSSANPRFKRARALQYRRGRKQYAQLLLEGVRLIEDSISAGYAPALVFVDPALLEENLPVLEQVQQVGTQIFSLEPALLAMLCDTVSPQGIVAVSPIPTLSPGTGGLTLIIDGLRDPGNLGTLLRSAAATGVDQVITLPGVTDPWAPKVLRAGMGAHFRVALRAAGTLQQLELWVGTAQRYLAEARTDTLYTEVDWTRPSVLVVGGETERGQMTEDWRGLQSIAIPMANRVESLNAAVAASIILFEAVRQRNQGLNRNV